MTSIKSFLFFDFGLGLLSSAKHLRHFSAGFLVMISLYFLHS
nr:MAG TPA: hypothetical protein [Caudoviricetes sp.]